MLTASHNPPTDNGIKLFRDGSEFDREAERAVEERVAGEEPPAAWDEWTETERVDTLDGYLDAVRAYAEGFGDDLDGLRIAVDCGNGMSAPATPTVLRELGAEVVTLNGNIDGHFPGAREQADPESLRDLRAFIADANEGGRSRTPRRRDRRRGVRLRDRPRRRLGPYRDHRRRRRRGPRDTVLALLAERYTRESDAADPVVVTTPNASGRIDERVREAGGRVERVRLGALHEGIAAVRAGERPGDDTRVVFAAEPWKHIHVGFGEWIDGVASAAVIARLVAESGLDALREPITERPYRKVSIDCPDEAKPGVMDRLGSTLPDAFPDATVDTDHGVRWSSRTRRGLSCDRPARSRTCGYTPKATRSMS